MNINISSSDAKALQDELDKMRDKRLSKKSLSPNKLKKFDPKEQFEAIIDKNTE